MTEVVVPTTEEVHKVRSAPRVVAPTNRINVALPFSKIQTSEPSKELSELADLVVELAAIAERLSLGREGETLLARAQALATALG